MVVERDLKQRKTRSDKKRDVKPNVPTELKEAIHRLHFITNTPIKDVVEQICIIGFGEKKVIDYLSKYFRRDIRISSTLYLGDIKREPVSKMKILGETERISTRFSSDMHDRLSALGYAMSCSVSRACGMLLEASIKDPEILDGFVKTYLEDNIDKERMTELKRIMKYINASNPYKEEYTWAALLSYMIDEVKETSINVQNTVNEFIVHHWRK